MWNKPTFLSSEEWNELLQQTWRRTATTVGITFFNSSNKPMWVRNGPASCRSSATHTSKLVLLPWHKLAASSSKQRSTKPMARAHSCLFCNHYQPFNNTTNTAGFARADLSDGKLAKQLARRHVANSHSTATCSLRSQVFQPTEITCAQIIATA